MIAAFEPVLVLFVCLIVSTAANVMPSVAEIEAIEATLKASLGRSRELDQNVASAAQRVLLQNIEFIPADKPHSMQLRYT